MPTLSIKNKTLLFVGTVFLLFMVALIGVTIFEQKTKLQKEEEFFHTGTQKAYAKILSRHSEFYYNRLKSQINSDGAMEAFFNRDRERLYKLIKGRWETLKAENKHLTVMHFHLPDGTSFLECTSRTSLATI